jgi:sporulation protein YlmC with PRC-barrel domain
MDVGEHTVPKVLSATTMIGDGVKNINGEDLGKVEEFMLDLNSGRIAYVVVSFGGVLGIGNKLFAIPWEALRLDTEDHKFFLDIDKETLEEAPGFDNDDWPDNPTHEWLTDVYSYYGHQPYWKPM